MFDYKYKVVKNECETTYGSICVKNIVFEPEEIEKVLPDIVLEDDNLKHMFAEENLNRRNKQNIYRRFVPKSGITTDLDSFIEDNIRTNKSFYSFQERGNMKDKNEIIELDGSVHNYYNTSNVQNLIYVIRGQ